jgi:SRSO17 transposase
MGYELDSTGVVRLEQYFGRIGRHLRDHRSRASFAMYAFGILGDGERKSAEPIAARACGDPEAARATHDKMLYFLGRSRWDDRAVRLEAAGYALEVLGQREVITTWIVDDTGFLKQGNHSVGVQRQYTGSAGKVCNCQIGVSLACATATEHVPIDFELYLPSSWADDPGRRKEARIPDDVVFKTKLDLALGMIERAARAGIPGEIILADGAYGDSSEFRNAIRLLGFDFGVGIRSSTKVVPIGPRDHPGDAPPLSAVDLAKSLGPRGFRRLTWREGTKGRLTSRFAFLRVKTVHDDGVALANREPLWLIMEWPEGESAPNKFLLSTLPRRMTKKEIVRVIKERWRTERMYEDLKGELGLDHFEGRSFPGWHHHVSTVLCCYNFVVAERVRAFPPSAGGAHRNRAIPCAA